MWGFCFTLYSAPSPQFIYFRGRVGGSEPASLHPLIHSYNAPRQEAEARSWVHNPGLSLMSENPLLEPSLLPPRVCIGRKLGSEAELCIKPQCSDVGCQDPNLS